MNFNKDTKNKDRKFIVSLAWVLIGFTAYSAVMSLAQGLMFLEKPPKEILTGYFENIDIYALLPSGLTYILENIYIELSFASFIFSLALLYPSIALLKFHNWARIFWAVFMIATIFIGIAGLFYIDLFMPQLPASQFPPHIIASMERMYYIFYLASALIIFIFHAWVAYKLLCKDIKKEFEAAQEIITKK